jgi:predicted nucleic acid-binding protein
MTEAELFSFADLGDAETEKIEAFLKTVSILPMDSRIARLAGAVRRTYGTAIADSIIAATALFTGSAIMTRNVRDFHKIESLTVNWLRVLHVVLTSCSI